MKSEFENWHYNSKDKSTSSAFAAGWMCQQSKIDELNCDINVQKEQLNKLDRVIDGYAIEVDELQKRVDAALKMISINRGFAWGNVSIGQLEQALKGGDE